MTTFQGLNLAQNVAQTLTTQLLNCPQVSRLILTAQGLLNVTNALLLIRDYMNLSEDIHKTPNSKLSMQYIIVAASLLSIAGVFFVSQAFKPSINLKDTLKTVAALSVQELESVQVYWDTPFVQRFGQFLSLNRIAINLFSIFINKSFDPITVVAQTFVFLKNVQAPWIKFEKTFIPPDGPFWSFPVPQEFISKLTLESHFLLRHPTQMLSSSLQHIYNYCTNFFNHSSNWDRLWELKMIHNPKPELIQLLTYCVAVKPPQLQQEMPYPNHLMAWAFDIILNRFVKVRLAIKS